MFWKDKEEREGKNDRLRLGYVSGNKDRKKTKTKLSKDDRKKMEVRKLKPDGCDKIRVQCVLVFHK